MNSFLKKLSIALLPTLLWLLLATIGIGAQSLANLVELMGIFLLSLFSTLIPEKIINWQKLLLILLIITLLIRLFTPLIPE